MCISEKLFANSMFLSEQSCQFGCPIEIEGECSDGDADL